ncbi:MAG: hypothetical protein MI757_18770, partial [Pirellulales bacterium]|nr:hypothetical protein [Pirellulales bacterium]
MSLQRKNFIALTLLTIGTVSESAIAVEGRVSRDLLVLYNFDETDGNVVRDRSGTGPPLDLKIENPNRVARNDGRLRLTGSTRITSLRPATKIIDACKKSRELSVEAWIQPANTRQAGPARIFSISRDTSNRNLTVGQDGDKYDVRLRTTSTSNNGLPSTASPNQSVSTKLTHVVYTRDSSGRARIYLNGNQRAEKKVAGALANWDSSYRLVLGNEQSGDRAWLGDMHLIAIYSRSLSVAEVKRNFAAGPVAKLSPELLAARKQKESAEHFATKVAPLLARRCLECHDTVRSGGGLDLSRKAAAIAGGDGGKILAPGNAAASSLWKLVASNEMPHERPPLTADEKQTLRKW